MSFVSGLINIVKGATAGVAVGVALPVFGAVGAISATGLAITSVAGAVLGAADSVEKDEDDE